MRLFSTFLSRKNEICRFQRYEKGAEWKRKFPKETRIHVRKFSFWTFLNESLIILLWQLAFKPVWEFTVLWGGSIESNFHFKIDKKLFPFLNYKTSPNQKKIMEIVKAPLYWVSSIIFPVLGKIANLLILI